MNELVQVLAIVAVIITGGWFATMATQVLKRPSWPSWLKLGLAIVISALVGLASVWLSGGLTGFISSWGHLSAAQVIAVCSLVYAAAATWYHRVYANTTWLTALAFWPDKEPVKPSAIAKAKL